MGSKLCFPLVVGFSPCCGIFLLMNFLQYSQPRGNKFIHFHFLVLLSDVKCNFRYFSASDVLSFICSSLHCCYMDLGTVMPVYFGYLGYFYWLLWSWHILGTSSVDKWPFYQKLPTKTWVYLAKYPLVPQKKGINVNHQHQ